jgi:hypothetical protein
MNVDNSAVGGCRLLGVVPEIRNKSEQPMTQS